METALKNKIEIFIDMKEGFEDLSFTEQIKYLAYFYVKSAGKKDFTPNDIKRILDMVSLPPPQNIQDLFNKLYSKGTFVKNKAFSINRKAFKELEKEFFQRTKEKDVEIFYISGNSPWTDRNERLSEFLKKLNGEIIIVEAHYGLGTFHVLENFQKGQKVKFLTAQLGANENEDKVEKELKRFKREFPDIELKRYPKFYEFHDRYILSSNMLVWVGHGIKDFGDKECFLIGISREKISEISQILEERFKERWGKSDNLS